MDPLASPKTCKDRQARVKQTLLRIHPRVAKRALLGNRSQCRGLYVVGSCLESATLSLQYLHLATMHPQPAEPMAANHVACLKTQPSAYMR